MTINTKTQICMIIGDPVEHSLSPIMHNEGYRALGMEDQFVFLASHVKSEDLKAAIEGVRILGIRGLTCTIPHKTAVMQYLDTIDPVAQKVGAVNTVVNEHGNLIGFNTDWLGVVAPIEALVSIKNKKVALIGAGGAARAMAYGIIHQGGLLSIYNRNFEKAKEIEKSIGGTARAIDQIDEIAQAEIILNATSIGMNEDVSPVPSAYLNKNQLVFDAVYSPYETRLIRDATSVGATIIHGTEMLLHQGTAQFELYTGCKAPLEVMRQTLLNHFHISL